MFCSRSGHKRDKKLYATKRGSYSFGIHAYKSYAKSLNRNEHKVKRGTGVKYMVRVAWQSSRSILKGERNRDVLVNLCHSSILKEKKEQVYKSLKGRYTNAGLFALQQAYDAYHFYQQQIEQCDAEINDIINKMGNSGQGRSIIKPRKRIRHHKPNVKNLGQNMLNVFDGKDATLLSGITDYTWMQLLAETGRDLSK